MMITDQHIVDKNRTEFKPHITVACVVQAENHFLLVEEMIDGHLRLNQPAGHLEANESIIDAARRELWEETGIDALPQSLLRIFQWTAPDNTPFIRFTFVIDLEQKPVTSPYDPDIVRCLWLPYAEIVQADNLRSPLVRESLRYYAETQRYPLDLLQMFKLT